MIVRKSDGLLGQFFHARVVGGKSVVLGMSVGVLLSEEEGRVSHGVLKPDLDDTVESLALHV